MNADGTSTVASYSAALAKHFTGSIEPIRRSPLYGFSLVVVAVAMILLPVLYGAMIASVALFGVWWAMAGFGMLFMDSGGGYIWRGLICVGLLCASGILLLFMIKPLFARRSREDSLYSLERTSRQLLSRLHSVVAGAAYPLEHKGNSLSIGEYLTGGLAQSSDFVAEQVVDAGSRFDLLYSRLMGRLALSALKVESAVHALDLKDVPTEQLKIPALRENSTRTTVAESSDAGNTYRLE